MATITLRKSVQIFEGGLYVKNVQNNFAKRALGAGTDNFFATSFTQVSNTLGGFGDLGTSRINRTFVIG